MKQQTPCKNCEELKEEKSSLFKVSLFLSFACIFWIIMFFGSQYMFKGQLRNSIPIPEGYKIVNATECYHEINTCALGYCGVGQDFNYSYVMCAYCYDGKIKENDECNINCNKRVRQMIEDNTKIICIPTDKLYTETCEEYEPYLTCLERCDDMKDNMLNTNKWKYMANCGNDFEICTKKSIKIQLEKK